MSTYREKNSREVPTIDKTEAFDKVKPKTACPDDYQRVDEGFPQREENVSGIFHPIEPIFQI